MSQEKSPFAYRYIRVEKEYEHAMVKLLIKSGQKFSAISKTDYLISNQQCSTLTENNVPYTKL